DNSYPSCSSCPSWFLICSVLVTLILFRLETADIPFKWKIFLILFPYVTQIKLTGQYERFHFISGFIRNIRKQCPGKF
ncbi:MAG: hypothetical protein DRI57_20920, partial [Deltaproteobacteria bacterium]